MLSVVMPAHDEEAYLEGAVRGLVGGLDEVADSFEVVVVENGSTDGTAAAAGELTKEFPQLRLITLERADYGGALKAGLLAAQGDLVAIFDVDYYDLGFLRKALQVLEGPDAPTIVVGTKRGTGAVDTRPRLRRLVTTVFATVLRVGFGLKVSDTHGMKVLRRGPLVELARACRYGTDLFDTELILRAQRQGLSAAEIPVVVEETRPSRSSIAGRIPRTMVGMVRLRIALWRGR